MTDKQLTIADATGIQVYTDGGMRGIIDQIKVEVAGVVPDLKTAKGRKAIASLAAKVARSKTHLDALGKELTADQKAATKAVDNERKAMRDELDDLRDEVRRPLTEWEDAEKERVADIQEWIRQIPAPEGIIASAQEWQNQIDRIESLEIDDSIAEFAAEAAKVKDHALTLARAELITAEAAERAEQDRIKAAADAQAKREQEIADNAAAQAKQQAEANAAAEAKRVSDARAAADNKREADRLQAIADKLAAEANAKRQADEAVAAEKRKQAVKEAEAAQAEAARTADIEHQRAINREALAELIKVCKDDEMAREVLIAIIAGQIPHTKVIY